MLVSLSMCPDEASKQVQRLDLRGLQESSLEQKEIGQGTIWEMEIQS